MDNTPYWPSLLVSAFAAAVSLTSLFVAVLAYRRTGREQTAKYEVRINWKHGILSNEAFDFEHVERDGEIIALAYDGKMINAGLMPAYIRTVDVCLAPKHRDDAIIPIQVPVYETLQPTASTRLKFALKWATVWDVAEHFMKSDIECRVVARLNRADGAPAQVNAFVASFTRIRDDDDAPVWVVFEKDLHLEVLRGLREHLVRRELGKAAELSDDPPF